MWQEHLDHEGFWTYLLTYWCVFQSKKVLAERRKRKKRDNRIAVEGQKRIVAWRKAWWRHVNKKIADGKKHAIFPEELTEGDIAGFVAINDGIMWYEREKQAFFICKDRKEDIFPKNILRKEDVKKIEAEPKQRIDIFESRKSFHNMTINAFDLSDFLRWEKDGYLDLAEILSLEELKHLGSLGLTGGKVAYQGRVVMEQGDGKIVIRLGTEAEAGQLAREEWIKRASKANPDKVASRAPRMVKRVTFPQVEAYSWFMHVLEKCDYVKSYKSNPDFFTIVSMAIVRALCKERRMVCTDIKPDDGSAEFLLLAEGNLSSDIGGNCLFVFFPWLEGTTEDQEREIASRLREIRFIIAGLRVQWLIAVTNEPVMKEWNAQVLRQKKVVVGCPVLLLGWSVLRGYLSRFPWVWSKYFGERFGFRVFRGDDAVGLRGYLLPGPLVRSEIIDDVMHPALLDMSVQGSDVVRVIGHPGSGKSVGVCQLVQKYFSDAVVVTIGAGFAQEQEGVVLALLEQLERDGARVVVVLDDVQHRVVAHVGDPGFRALFAKLVSGEHRVLLLAYCTDRKLPVESVLESVLAGKVTKDIFLDDPPLAFVEALVVAAARVFSVEFSDLCDGRCVAERLRQWDGRPLSIVAVMRSFSGTLVSARALELCCRSGASFWSVKYAELVGRGVLLHARVLQVLGLFAYSMDCSPALEWVVDAVSRIAGEPRSSVFTVVDHLGSDGWVVVRDGRVCFHAVQVSSALGAVLRDDVSILGFCEWLVDCVVVPDERKRSLLLGLGCAFLFDKRFDVSMRVFGFGCERFVGDVDFFAGLGLALASAGRVEEAKSVLAVVVGRVEKLSDVYFVARLLCILEEFGGDGIIPDLVQRYFGSMRGDAG